MVTQSDSQDQGNQIRQAIDQNQGQAIGQISGGLVVGQLTVYLSQTPTDTTPSPLISGDFAPNPYQGLQAFREVDGDRFFGRSNDIQALVDRFQSLQVDRETVRVLPIYGPSGSGKSSLARAGLIPALSQQYLPGRSFARVLVLTPGDRPLEALATVLARIATNDATPVAKTREFVTELRLQNSQNQFDGLRRLADVFPDIDRQPMIILVDQFEEIYTLCKQEVERSIFVENLLCAAGDLSQHISVILTLRSDFLGATHRHPQLNRLFSSQGFLVPIMQRDQLAIAITEPAKRAGHEIDKATVQLLLEQAADKEGALPLLQFALTEIWEGLRRGIAPADTLEQIGGVGGALANKAKSLYEALSPAKKKIARLLFLSLIQLHEDHKSTRRRVAIAELVTCDGDETTIRETIDCFAKPGVWILVTSCNEQQIEMVEIAHEALIRNWQELQEWLKLEWEALRKKHKIEEATHDWLDHNRSKDYLLQGRSLRDAKEFQDYSKHAEDTTVVLRDAAIEFIRLSQQAENRDLVKRAATVFGLATLLVAPALAHFFLLSAANWLLYQDGCQPNLMTNFFLKYQIDFGGTRELSHLRLCGENLTLVNFSGSKLDRLQDINFSRTDLSSSNFSRSYVEKSNFNSAYLFNADLQETLVLQSTFSQAQFLEANLSGAIFIGGDFRATSFRNSVLKQTIFIDADLSTSNLTPDQIRGIKVCRSKLPRSLDGNVHCNDKKVRNYLGVGSQPSQK